MPVHGVAQRLHGLTFTHVACIIRPGHRRVERKPKAPVYSSSDSSDEQEDVFAVVKRRRPKKKAVRIIYAYDIYEDELLVIG
jgi:hypothetical protein